MVPRDLFDKMAALALVAIALVAILSLEAFAAEAPYQDSGVVAEESEGPGGSEEPPGLLAEVAGIRRDMDIILYVVIPVSAAVLFVYLLCKWFCSTFVDSVL